MIGIYRIRNLIDGKCYYGSSKNVEKRWKKHKNDLTNNRHHNIKLQRAWNKYSEKQFIFEIVEICDIDKLLIIEQKYLDKHLSYNIGMQPSGGDNLTKNPNRNIIINKIKESGKKWRESLNIDDRKTLFSKPMERNPKWKGGISFSYCEICNKKITQNACRCSEHVEYSRNGELNPFFGKKHTDDYKKRASERMKGKYNGEQNKPIVINGKEYMSLGDASQKLNISPTTIRYRVLSKNPKYKDYRYKGESKKCYTEVEQYERLSIPHRNKKTKTNKAIIINGVEYRTLQDASNVLGIHIMTIRGRVLSKNFVNYKYK